MRWRRARPIDLDDYGKRWQEGLPWSEYLTPKDVRDRAGSAVEKGLISEEDARRATSTWPGVGRTILRVPFAHGVLAMSNRGPEPFTDSDISLLERFAEVFALGYRRYLDLEAAEERARQADLDRARQRVRGEVMSMKQTEDIVGVMRDELNGIGVTCDEVGINIIDEANDTVRTQWSSMLSSGTDEVEQRDTRENVGAGSSPLVPYWRERKVWSRRRSDTGGPGDKGWVVDVPFEYGTVAMNRGQTDDTAEEFTGDEIDTLGSFAEVVALGYTRFLDFQRLEEQNRALTVDRALERVRAEVASMRLSDDIASIMGMVFTELQGLGIQTDTAVVMIPDEGRQAFRQYAMVPQKTFAGTPITRNIADGIDMYRGDRPFRGEEDDLVAIQRTQQPRLTNHKPLTETETKQKIEEIESQFGLKMPPGWLPQSSMNVPFSHGVLLLQLIHSNRIRRR